MVDFANGNLCGASPELNSVLSKLDEAKAEITSKIDEAASTASAAFGAAKNELNGLVGKLQTIEIPDQPKLNLQSEITSLVSQIPASPAFFSALAKIELEFGDDIKTSGLNLGGLITKASTAISAGGDVCAAVPNLEKVSGSKEPSKQEPTAVKQAVVPAVAEVASKVKQNLNIETRVSTLSLKMSSFFTSSIPPKTDTPAFKISPASVIKSINVSGSSVKAAVPPSSAGERTNYVPENKGNGFSYKKSQKMQGANIDNSIRESGKAWSGGGKLEDTGDGYYNLTLKYKPTKILRIYIYPNENFTRDLIGERNRILLGFEEPSTIENKQFSYRNYYGRHMALLYADSGGRIFSSKTNIAIFGKTLRFYSPIKLISHPGNIDSGGFAGRPDEGNIFARTGIEPFTTGQDVGGYPGVRIPGKPGDDIKYNKGIQGAAVLVKYEYLEKYDADFTPVAKKPTATEPVATPISTPKKEELKKIKSAADRKPTAAVADLQKLADADGRGLTVTAVRTHTSGMNMVTVSSSAGQFYSLGTTPRAAYEGAARKATKTSTKATTATKVTVTPSTVAGTTTTTTGNTTTTTTVTGGGSTTRTSGSY